MPFQATIIQMVMDVGSQQTPSDIWYSCQHVSVLLLCSGKPQNPTRACQISHSAQFRTLIELIFIKHTHPHIHIDAHPHRRTGIQNGLIVIQAIVVPFSHASQTTVKTHSNRLWLHHMSQYRDLIYGDWSSLTLQIPIFIFISRYKRFIWLLDPISTHNETCILPVCCPSWRLVCYFNTFSVFAIAQAGHRGPFQSLLFQW